MRSWLRRLFSADREYWPGADESYASELHQISEEFHIQDVAKLERQAIAEEFGLDPLEHLSIIEDVLTLRRALAASLDTARARWARLVEPTRRAWLSEVPSGPLTS